jgi:hypothetical protein
MAKKRLLSDGTLNPGYWNEGNFDLFRGAPRIEGQPVSPIEILQVRRGDLAVQVSYRTKLSDGSVVRASTLLFGTDLRFLRKYS